MSYNFLPYDERQLYLLPASIVEWVKDDSLARFVGQALNQAQTSAGIVLRKRPSLPLAVLEKLYQEIRAFG